MFTFARSASLNAATRYCIAFIFFVSSILFSYDFEMHFFDLKADYLDDFFQGMPLLFLPTVSAPPYPPMESDVVCSYFPLFSLAVVFATLTIKISNN